LPTATEPTTGGRLTAAFAGLRSAAAFLTIVPVPLARRADGGFSDAPAWFPLIGGCVGGVAGGVRAGLAPALGRAVATVLALAATAVLTGALHLDGLADTADGLGVRGDHERRLDVMRDSANGTFATLALGLWGMLSFAAVESLSARHALEVLIAAAACGRWMAVVHGALLSPARDDGLGASFAPGARQTAAATALAVAIGIAALGTGHGAIVLGAALVGGGAFTVFTRRAFGGLTGDTIGACVVVAETGALLAGVALLGS